MDKKESAVEQLKDRSAQVLTEQRSALLRRRNIRQLTNRALVAMAILVLVASGIIILRNPYLASNQILSSILLVGGIAFLLIRFMNPVSQIDLEIADVQNQLDMLLIPVNRIEQRAEKLFKNHQIELKKYYDQSLRHSGWIFGVGVACLIAGFIIIGCTLYFLVYFPKITNIGEKIISACVGAVGAVLSDFIAVIYLRMFSETIKTLTDFHNRLVLTHHLHFSNFLSAKITNKDQREKTLAEIALNLSKQ